MAPRQLIDISMRVSPRLAVFPGDTPLTREVLLDQRDGATVTLSTKRMTVHMGTHADAPLHYMVGGASIDQQPLDLYWGICDVVHVRDPLRARGRRIGWDDIVWKGPTTPRVLIGTGTFDDPERWTEEFAGLEPDLIDRMAAWAVEKRETEAEPPPGTMSIVPLLRAVSLLAQAGQRERAEQLAYELFALDPTIPYNDYTTPEAFTKAWAEIFDAEGIQRAGQTPSSRSARSAARIGDASNPSSASGSATSSH